MRYVNGIVMVCVLFFLIPIATLAGNLNDPGAPADTASAMYTLEDIYNRLDAGTAGTKRTGAFTEPSSGPGSTGYTTDEVMGKAPSVDNTNGAGAADVASGKTFWGLKSGEWGIRTGAYSSTSAPVAKTGQTLCYDVGGYPTSCSGTPGQDGNKLKGVTWPDPRFTENFNGTVTDNLTGLIWLQKADYNSTTSTTGTADWANALSFCNALENGQCGLSDGSSAGDWRLPNVKELQSLIDFSQYNPALPSGHPFTGVPTSGAVYWSSTTGANNTGYAWIIDMNNGVVHASDPKATSSYVWPVRGGQ